MTRKKLLPAIACVLLLAGGGAAFFLNQGRDDARILSPLPAGMHFIPASEFPGKAIIDLPWFGGNRLTYPPKRKMPSGFKKTPEMSGFLAWDDDSSQVGGMPGWISEHGPMAFAYGIWKTSSGANQALDPSWHVPGREYLRFPTVLGTLPLPLRSSIRTHLGISMTRFVKGPFQQIVCAYSFPPITARRHTFRIATFRSALGPSLSSLNLG